MSIHEEDAIGAFLKRMAATQQESSYETLFEGGSYDDLLTFLALGTVNIETFDAVGLKSLAELYEECRGRDIVLTRDQAGTVYRHAKSSKIQIVVPSEHICYRESGRTFLRKGVHIRHSPPKWEGVSETAKHKEKPWETAANGLDEELGSGIPLENLDCLPPEQQPKPTICASSVYPGIVSKTFVTRFRLTLYERLWEGNRKIIKDGNIEVHIREFPYKDNE